MSKTVFYAYNIRQISPKPDIIKRFGDSLCKELTVVSVRKIWVKVFPIHLRPSYSVLIGSTERDNQRDEES